MNDNNTPTTADVDAAYEAANDADRAIGRLMRITDHPAPAFLAELIAAAREASRHYDDIYARWKNALDAREGSDR